MSLKRNAFNQAPLIMHGILKCLKHRMRGKKVAFTLAEVLITLTIIGVVASMTIPTLMNNYQKKEYTTRLKKFYVTANEALKLMSLDKGCTNDLRCTGLFDSGTDNQSLGEVLVKYFKVAKDCGINTGEGCWATATNANYDGSSVTNENWDNDSVYKFITADGMSFIISNYANSCDTPTWSTGATRNMSQTCGYIRVDVNGPEKGPNNRGRDTFTFFITNGKGALLYPESGIDDNFSGTNSWWRNPSTEAIRYCHPGHKAGYACPGRIMEENWEMNY